MLVYNQLLNGIFFVAMELEKDHQDPVPCERRWLLSLSALLAIATVAAAIGFSARPTEGGGRSRVSAWQRTLLMETPVRWQLTNDPNHDASTSSFVRLDEG